MMYIAFIRLYKIASKRIFFYQHAPDRREKNESKKEKRKKREKRKRRKRKKTRKESEEREKEEGRREKEEKEEKTKNSFLLSLSERRRKKKANQKEKWRFAPGRAREALFLNLLSRNLP